MALRFALSNDDLKIGAIGRRRARSASQRATARATSSLSRAHGPAMTGRGGGGPSPGTPPIDHAGGQLDRVFGDAGAPLRRGLAHGHSASTGSADSTGSVDSDGASRSGMRRCSARSGSAWRRACSSTAAAMNETNSGCGWYGRLLYSGWNWQPRYHGCSGSSTISTNLPSGERPETVRPPSVSRERYFWLTS